MTEFMKSIIDPLKESAGVKSVFGEPIQAQGRTVIPVARIVYGFGGGAGQGSHQAQTGEGQGGGGGVVAMPVGMVEITSEHTRFVPLNDKRKLAAMGLGGLCLGMLWAKLARSRRGQVKA
jgi:uncharacterized spore protein YtfJ